MGTNPTLYQIIGVEETAPVNVIKSNFMRQYQHWYAQIETNPEEANNTIRRLIKAYQILTNETSRLRYDGNNARQLKHAETTIDLFCTHQTPHNDGSCGGKTDSIEFYVLSSDLKEGRLLGRADLTCMSFRMAFIRDMLWDYKRVNEAISIYGFEFPDRTARSLVTNMRDHETDVFAVLTDRFKRYKQICFQDEKPYQLSDVERKRLIEEMRIEYREIIRIFTIKLSSDTDRSSES